MRSAKSWLPMPAIRAPRHKQRLTCTRASSRLPVPVAKPAKANHQQHAGCLRFEDGGPMGGRNVVFIGFQDQENLGVGYLASVVLKAGFSPHILDYRLGAERLYECCAKLQPVCIGFSIIFQI